MAQVRTGKPEGWEVGRLEDRDAVRNLGVSTAKMEGV